MASAFEGSIGSDQRRWMQSPRRPAIASSSGISSGDVLIADGTRPQHTCCAIEIRWMVRLLPGAYAPWVFVIDQLRRGRHGNMPMPIG